MLTHSISISKQNIAVVTNGEECANDFYKDLKKSITTFERVGNSRIDIEHVIYHKLEVIVGLHQMKWFIGNIIITLVPSQSVLSVIKTLSAVVTSDISPVWLVPSTHVDTTMLKDYPRKLLFFDISVFQTVSYPYNQLSIDVQYLVDSYNILETSTNTRYNKGS